MPVCIQQVSSHLLEIIGLHSHFSFCDAHTHTTNQFVHSYTQRHRVTYFRHHHRHYQLKLLFVYCLFSYARSLASILHTAYALAVVCPSVFVLEPTLYTPTRRKRRPQTRQCGVRCAEFGGYFLFVPLQFACFLGACFVFPLKEISNVERRRRRRRRRGLARANPSTGVK